MKSVIFDCNISDSNKNRFGYTENKQMKTLIELIQGKLQIFNNIKSFTSYNTKRESSLEQRYTKIANTSADMVIHLCTVERDDYTSSGCFLFHSSEPDTIKLGCKLVQNIEKVSGLYNLGVYPYRKGDQRNMELPDEFSVLKYKNTLSLVVGVRTNKDDARILTDVSKLDTIADGIVDGLRELWNLEAKPYTTIPKLPHVIDQLNTTGEYVYVYTGMDPINVYRTVDACYYDKEHKIGTLKRGDLVTLTISQAETELYKKCEFKELVIGYKKSISTKDLDLTYVKPVYSNEGDIFQDFFLDVIEDDCMVRTIYPAKLYYDCDMYADEAVTVSDVAFTIVEKKNHYGRIKNTGLWVFLDNDYWDNFPETDENNAITPDILAKPIRIELMEEQDGFLGPEILSDNSTGKVPKGTYNIIEQTLDGWGKLAGHWINIIHTTGIHFLGGRKWYVHEPIEYRATVSSPIKVEGSRFDITIKPADGAFDVTKEKNNHAYIPVYGGWIDIRYIKKL